MPDLDFSITGAGPDLYAAVPTLLFTLRLTNAVAEERIESIVLRTQIRLEVTRRQYDSHAEGRLLELFGEPKRWGDTLHTLLWTHITTAVPGFAGSAEVTLPVPCTYDFEVAAAKYFHALEDGEIPLLFLFSGSIFYASEEGALQVSQVPWEKEATFRLPVATWRELMDRYFPGSTWLRLSREAFDRLYAYRVGRAHPTWEAALDELLDAREARIKG